MQGLIKRAVEPALAALARSCESALLHQQSACGPAVRRFATGGGAALDATASAPVPDTAVQPSFPPRNLHAGPTLLRPHLSRLLERYRESFLTARVSCFSLRLVSINDEPYGTRGPLADAGAATPPQQQGGGGFSGGNHSGSSSPHRFSRPYRSDIRRFVDGTGQSPESVLATGEPASGVSAGDGLPPPRLDLVKQYLSEDTASAAERRQAELRSAMRAFQRFEGDTGSSEVQVALLTTRINQLAEHMREHRKDFASRRGLEACIAQRRSLLQYLRRTSFTAYAHLISRLGLRDTYAKLDRVTLQIQQRRTRGPSKPQKAKAKGRR